jgi:hypothetical protein
MQLTVTAEWTHPTPTADRIAIAGYTAVVEAVDVPNGPSAHTAYQYTVLRDHLEIVEVGHRFDRIAAHLTVERIIAEHIVKPPA